MVEKADGCAGIEAVIDESFSRATGSQIALTRLDLWCGRVSLKLGLTNSAAGPDYELLNGGLMQLWVEVTALLSFVN